MEVKEKVIDIIKKIFKNSFLRSTIIYTIGVLLLVYKSTLLNGVLIGIRTDKIIAMVPITLLIMLPAFLGKNKFNIKYLNITYGLLTFLIYSNFLYYSFSTSFLSVYQLSNLQYAGEIASGLTVILSFKMFIVFWIDNILLAILSFIYLRKTKGMKTEISIKYRKQIKYIFCIIVITFNIIWYFAEIKPTYDYWDSNRAYNVQNNSIYYYHIADLHEYINEVLKKEKVDYDRLVEASSIAISVTEPEQIQLEEKDLTLKTNKYDGIAKGYNIIILQLESMHEFVINKTINGQEITPNLNKFYSENIYCTNMYNQGLGSTADSEHSMATSLYPLENGRVFQKYSNNTWNSIYQDLKENNYYTVFMHPNVNTYWNRFDVYNNGFKIDEYNDINNFYDTGERASRFFSDEQFLIQSLDKLESYESPYIATLVCTTGHSPFTLETINNVEKKISIDVSDIEDETFANYLKAINFVDYSFRLFIQGLEERRLLDNTILAVYGDHGVGMHDKEALEKLCIENNVEYNELDKKFENVHVPFGIYIPGVKSMIINRAVAKIDIKPTIMGLLGENSTFALGESIFSSKDYAFIKDLGIVTENYYITEEIIDRNSYNEIEELFESSRISYLKEKMNTDIYLSDSIIKHNLFKDEEFLNRSNIIK